MVDYKKKYLKYKKKYLAVKKMEGGVYQGVTPENFIEQIQNGKPAPYVQKVNALLAVGADSNAKDSNTGTTALMYAAQHGHEAVVQALLAKKANPDAKNSKGNTALMRAAQRGHAAVVEALLAKGADPNEQDSDGATALMWATRFGLEAVEEVLREAIDKQ